MPGTDRRDGDPHPAHHVDAVVEREQDPFLRRPQQVRRRVPVEGQAQRRAAAGVRTRYFARFRKATNSAGSRVRPGKSATGLPSALTTA